MSHCRPFTLPFLCGLVQPWLEHPVRQGRALAIPACQVLWLAIPFVKKGLHHTLGVPEVGSSHWSPDSGTRASSAGPSSTRMAGAGPGMAWPGEPGTVPTQDAGPLKELGLSAQPSIYTTST